MAKSFEQSLQRLEQIVDLLESGEAPLNKIINLYKEGMELSDTCVKTLDDAKKQIMIVRGQKVEEVNEL